MNLEQQRQIVTQEEILRRDPQALANDVIVIGEAVSRSTRKLLIQSGIEDLEDIHHIFPLKETGVMSSTIEENAIELEEGENKVVAYGTKQKDGISCLVITKKGDLPAEISRGRMVNKTLQKETTPLPITDLDDKDIVLLHRALSTLCDEEFKIGSPIEALECMIKHDLSTPYDNLPGGRELVEKIIAAKTHLSLDDRASLLETLDKASVHWQAIQRSIYFCLIPLVVYIGSTYFDKSAHQGTEEMMKVLGLNIARGVLSTLLASFFINNLNNRISRKKIDTGLREANTLIDRAVG